MKRVSEIRPLFNQKTLIPNTLRPDEKLHKAMVFYGKERTGKSLLAMDLSMEESHILLDGRSSLFKDKNSTESLIIRFTQFMLKGKIPKDLTIDFLEESPEQILLIVDDVPPKFSYPQFYDLIVDGIKVNDKTHYFKIIITTNHTPTPINYSSFKRRFDVFHFQRFSEVVPELHNIEFKADKAPGDYIHP